MGLPDLSLFYPHKEIDGVVVPGLSAGFHRRAAGGRVESVGVYRYAGVEVFMAWGYVGEAHCRFTAFHEGPAGWGAIRPGCPDPVEVTSRVDTLRTLLAPSPS